MAIEEKAIVEVQVNSQEAKDHLKDLENHAVSLRKQMDAAFDAGDTAHLTELRKELKKVEHEIKTTKKDTTALTEVMQHLNTATPKELRATLKAINRELNSGHIKRGSKEWEYYQKQIKLVNRELRSIQNETREAESLLSRFNNGLSKWGGMVASGVAALTGVAMTLNTLKNNRNSKEDAQAELEALTGLSADSIAWLTEQAEILSTTMEKNGLRIRQSTDEILKAYMLVGSKKPELLGDKDALNAVTIEAMRLAAAAKIDLTEAVEATTISLNMFGEKADQAAKYVNILAAGSQAGSAAVAAQTATIKNAGVAAATAGVTMEQLNGVIQTLAKKGIEAEPAGTALRKFFLVLQTGADETNPKIVGLDKALENLAAQELTAAELQKKFGDEAFSAASIIINGTEDYKHFTEAVTGTSVAIQQAAINSDTASAKLEQHKNKMKEAGIELMERLNPSFAVLTGWTSKTIAALPGLIDWFIKYKNVILVSTAAIAGYTVVIKASTIATKAHAFWTKSAAAAQVLLNTAMKANPAGLLIGGLTALGTYLATKLIPDTDKATAAQKAYNEELRNTQEELERFTNIENRYNNMDALNERQRQKLKTDAQSEIAIIEDKLTKETLAYRKFYKEQKAAIEKRTDVDENQRQALLKSLSSQADEKAAELDYLLKRKQKLTEVINSIPDSTKKKPKKVLSAEQAEKNEMERYQKELIDMKKLYISNDSMTRQDYNKAVEGIEERHVDNMLKIKGLETEKRQQLMNRLLDLKMRFREQNERLNDKQQKDDEKIIKDADDVAFNRLKKQYELDVTDATKRHYDSLSSEAEYYDELKNLRDQYYEDVMNSTEISEKHKADIQLQIEKENLKESKDNYDKHKDNVRQTLEVYQDLGRQFGETFASLITDSEASIGDFFKETIKLTLNALEKMMIASIAQVQIDALKESGPLTFLALAKAAGKIALITAAFETAKGLISGFEDGGFTGPGAHDAPVGVVHAGEFVANRHAVSNPQVRPVLNLIDTAQRNNTIGSLTAADLSSAIIRSGNTYSTVNNYTSPDDNLGASLAQLLFMVDKLNKRLDIPILAYTKAAGPMGVNEAQSLIDKMTRNASRL